MSGNYFREKEARYAIKVMKTKFEKESQRYRGMLDLAIASSALHFLVSDLQRSQASSASLLLIFLVWPFLELSEALSSIMVNGMSFSLELGSPLISCLFASLISSLVWLVAVFLPDA